MSQTEDKKPVATKDALNLDRFQYGTTFMTGGHLRPGSSGGHVHGVGCGCGLSGDEDEDMDEQHR